MRYKFLIIILLLSFTVCSQELTSVNYNKTPLEDVLKDIEVKYAVKFSFNTKLLKNQFITLNNDEIDLNSILEAITKQSRVSFKKITDRYYTIRANNSSISNLQELDEVLLTEYPTIGINKKSDGSISVSPDKLAILPGLIEPDVLQSLQILPGLQSPDETAAGLYIRGATPDQNLVLWDGIKMYYSGHFFGILSAFNPYVTNEVNLTKNGTRARYGNALSGVIDITSTPDVPKELKVGFGSNLTHADFYVKAPVTNKIGLVVSARRSFTDVFETITFSNFSDRVFQDIRSYIDENELNSSVDNTFYFADYTAKIIAELSPKDKLTFSTLYTNNDLDYEFRFEDDVETSRDRLDIKNRGASLTWNRTLNEKVTFKTEAFFSNFELDYSGEKTFFGFFEEGEKRNDIKEIGASIETNIKLNETHAINAGYQFSSNDVSYSLYSFQELFDLVPFEESLSLINNTHTLYSEYQYNSDKFEAIAGVRATNYSVADNMYLEPRLTLKTKLTNDIKLKAAFEAKTQAVSQVIEFQSSNLGFGLENQVWTLASGDSIPIQRSRQFSAGFEFQKNKWNIDVEAYYRNIKGITTNTRGFRDVSFFYTTGSTEAFGVDVLVNKKIGNYRTWIAYSFLNNDITIQELNFDTFEFNNDMTYPGNYDITHNFSWSHAYNFKNLEVSLGWRIRTGRPYTELESITSDEEFIFFNFGDVNEERLPTYHRLDFSSTYKFKFSKDGRWKGKVGISVINLYDRENVLFRQFFLGDPLDDSNTPDYEVIQSDFFSFGITPNLVFRVEF
ncbi:TonB-dependent receptor plug domain-containing protein [uncultured Psychroserpens sp.]|uniref:TonB-dependent receptor plug domain-containing protein n=1 Tax=uncultured Psychroserpens sp. TaxID=255436 RepID=UPI002637123D|nr:TonB-dependent receptor plug domain-containing protein [uncultured Psychroserpens sp.]